MATSETLVLPDLRDLLRSAAAAVQVFVAEAKGPVKAKVSRDGKVDRKLADLEQHIVHGYGWYATYAELFTQVSAWADALESEGRFGETEALLAQLLLGEYSAQLLCGIAMNQGETIRPFDFGLRNRSASSGARWRPCMPASPRN